MLARWQPEFLLGVLESKSIVARVVVDVVDGDELGSLPLGLGQEDGVGCGRSGGDIDSGCGRNESADVVVDELSLSVLFGARE